MMRTRAMFAVLAMAAGVFACGGGAPGGALVVGSKAFTENVILGHVLAGILRDAGFDAVHREQLGGTRVLWNAVLGGEIDAYVEYTGTLSEEIFSGEVEPVLDDLQARVQAHGLRLGRPLGFVNTYAVGVPRAVAQTHGLAAISDLLMAPDLRLTFSNEFMDREDGWPGLRAAYGLPQTNVRGLDHDLAYRALESGEIDGTDLYSTDPEIRYYDLLVLDDDRGYFPDYRAVIVAGAQVATSPRVFAALQRLEGAIDAPKMIAMNAAVKLDGETERAVAARFLQDEFAIAPTGSDPTRLERIGARATEHLFLVLVSLSAAIMVALPLGIAAGRHAGLGRVILSIVGVVQTVPSLALLVFLIPVLGIGAPPAIVALFLYSLLPIVRNTATGLLSLPGGIIESAVALGLPSRARLLKIELPMILPAILAGIKTAAVINVGTATLGALIGAGGFGQPILTGIRLDDAALILEGAVPAAALALLTQALFDGVERLIVPRGLRL